MQKNEILDKNYSHVPEFTGYMKMVYDLVAKNLNNRNNIKILNLPAGNGFLSDKLRQLNCNVINADINAEREDYVYANMDDKLPFKENEFDYVICLEGIEHVISPATLISELCRICKENGAIILSTPNILNMYSRIQFLFTGSFYQFYPWGSRHVKDNEQLDKGHISPVSYAQLRYLFKHYGAEVLEVRGDKYKRKILLPLYLLINIIGYLWFKLGCHIEKYGRTSDEKSLSKGLFSQPVLFSRSLIMLLRKNKI